MPFLVFFFNDTATTEIYTLSLHDALPISSGSTLKVAGAPRVDVHRGWKPQSRLRLRPRSEEHTSELQSRLHLVCRLLLEKKKKQNPAPPPLRPPPPAPQPPLSRTRRPTHT